MFTIADYFREKYTEGSTISYRCRRIGFSRFYIFPSTRKTEGYDLDTVLSIAELDTCALTVVRCVAASKKPEDNNRKRLVMCTEH